MKILIAESEPVIADDLKKTLETFEYNVVGIASSKIIAIQRNFLSEPDVIVSDTRLETDFDGIDLAIKLQEKRNIPIIFITPHNLELIAEKASNIKYYDSVQMPFKFEELIKKIELVYYYSQAEKLEEKVTNKISKISNKSGDQIIENRVGYYILPSRIDEIRAINSSKYDFSRLIAICEELNSAILNKCYFSIGMLIRSLIDHIPPLFEKNSFAEVANNYEGDKSFKDLMKRLDKSQRLIADRYLHAQIGRKEILPSFVQIDFKAELDILLSEIIKICHWRFF